MHHHKYRRCNCRGNHNNESCPIQPSYTLAPIHSKRRDMAKTLAQTLNIFIIIWSIFVWCCKHEYECDEDLYYINQKKTEQKRHIYVCYRHHHHQIQKKTDRSRRRKTKLINRVCVWWHTRQHVFQKHNFSSCKLYIFFITINKCNVEPNLSPSCSINLCLIASDYVCGQFIYVSV